MPTTQTQTNSPWGPAAPYMTFGMQQGQNLYNQGQGFNAPPFQTYVPFSGATKEALKGTAQLARQGNPLAGGSMQTVQGMLSGGAQDQKYNDLLAQAGNPYFETAVQNQADRTAADVQRQFGGLGRIGSAADTGALVDQIGNMRTQALSNQWQQNIANQRGILSDQSGMQLNAVGAAPGAYEQQYLPMQHLGQVGAAREDLAQRRLQSQLDNWNTTQQAPWNRLNAFTGVLSGSGGNAPGFATQTVSHPSSFFSSLLGGAYGGASIGNQILPGGMGAGFGALAGGALGGLSSQDQNQNRLFGF